MWRLNNAMPYNLQHEKTEICRHGRIHREVNFRMKHFTRLMSVLVVVALLVGTPVLSVFAQDDNPLCSGLEAADCATLNSAASAMDGVSSFRIPSWSFTLQGTDGTQNIDVSASGSGEVMLPADPAAPTEGLLIHLVVDQASMSLPGEEPQSGGVELLVLGDMAYVNYNGQWYGEQLTPEDAQEMADTFGAGAGGDAGMLEGLDMDFTGVITTARGTDGELEGQAMQSFVTTVDINALLMAVLSSPAFGALLGMGMGEEAQGMDQMTPEDMQMMAAIFGPMLTGTTVSFEQWIGADDSLIHRLNLDVVLSLNLAMFDPEAGVISGELHFTTDLSEHNGTFTVEAPTDFLPMEELEEQGGIFSELSM